MTTIPEGVKKPTDRKPRAQKPKVYHLEIKGVEVDFREESLNDADYLYLASQDDFDTEDVQLLVNLLVRMIGKPAYRALLAAYRAEAKDGRSGFDVNAEILKAIMEPIADASESAGN